MMEDAVQITVGQLQLEGLLSRGAEDKGVVVTHPHPLYGGEMYNPVVETIAAAYADNGYTTLRFNFRGTGLSDGRFSGGGGEQEDALAAVDYLKQLGVDQIDLAGYSFGAWVNAGAVARLPAPIGMVMVAPPVGFLDFSGLTPTAGTRLIVSGSADDIAPTAAIRKWVTDAGVDVPIEVLTGADHFFSGSLGKLEEVVKRYLGARD
jgi:alpha/beta superfamily hydrolase